MAGHSKFSNIKHKKERNDKKRAKLFTKLRREIMVAINEGGADPEFNSSLDNAIRKAKSNNMPNKIIDRAIKKATEGKEGNNFEKIQYEGYGPNGVAVIVESLTDNRNRTGAAVRSYFSKCAGNLGTTGCVSYMFERKGQIMIEKSDDIDKEGLFMIVVEAGAEDMKTHEEGYEVLTDFESFNKVNKALDKENIETLSSEIKMIPQNEVDLENDDDINNMELLVEMLEEDDDVQNVWHNWAE